jgi:hypothetical protein
VKIASRDNLREQISSLTQLTNMFNIHIHAPTPSNMPLDTMIFYLPTISTSLLVLFKVVSKFIFVCWAVVNFCTWKLLGCYCL